jgi:nondiscriminating aspartyl-tRNA synthetase
MMERVTAAQIGAHAGQRVRLNGWLHRVRKLGDLAFLVVKDRSGMAQAVWEKPPEKAVSETAADGPVAGARAPAAAGLGGAWPDNPALIPPESAVAVTGTVRAEPRAPGGYEVVLDGLEVIAAARPDLPLELAKPTIDAGLDLILDHRPLSLRHPPTAAVFRTQATIGRVFRRFLEERGFVEVHTPKIVACGTEGGAELFPLRYFERQAYLAQSPQLYKQMLVGAGLERVFEVGPAFRAEQHNTSRHINEFTSLDLEMGFIESEEDVMRLEEEFLAVLLDELAGRAARTVEARTVEARTVEARAVEARETPPPNLPHLLPGAGATPRLTLAEAHEILIRHYGHACPPDGLDPEGERLIGRHVAEQAGSDFVFITRWPTSARPPYTYRDPSAPHLTRSFDLLLRGLEVTTGGQRLHNPDQLTASLVAAGLDPVDFEFYLEIFRYGMPPHGGLAIGLERLTMRLLGLANIREATLFPRDRGRLAP